MFSFGRFLIVSRTRLEDRPWDRHLPLPEKCKRTWNWILQRFARQKIRVWWQQFPVSCARIACARHHEIGQTRTSWNALSRCEVWIADCVLPLHYFSSLLKSIWVFVWIGDQKHAVPHPFVFLGPFCVSSKNNLVFINFICSFYGLEYILRGSLLQFLYKLWGLGSHTHKTLWSYLKFITVLLISPFIFSNTPFCI